MLAALLLSTLAFFSPLATSNGEPVGTAQQKATHVVINEICFDGTDYEGEFVELYNPTTSAVPINDWFIGTEPDLAGIATTYEAGWKFPAGASIGAEETIIIASNGTNFADIYNVAPDYEFNATNALIPDMIRLDTDPRPRLSTFAYLTASFGDSVWLNDSAGNYVDGLGFGNVVEGGAAPLTGKDKSLERYICWLDTDDNSKDFKVTDPPTPDAVTLRPTLIFEEFTLSANEVAAGTNVTIDIQIWDVAFALAGENATLMVTMAPFLAGSAARTIATTAVNATNATYTATIDTSIMAGTYRIVATAEQQGFNNVTETRELAVIDDDTFVVLMVDDTDTHGIHPPYGAQNTGQWQAVFKNRTNTIVRFHSTGRFNASTFSDVDFFIMPMTPGPNGTAPAKDDPLDSKNVTIAEAAVIKSFVDGGGRMLLCGYYERGYWMWNSTNRIAEQWGVSYVVPDPSIYVLQSGAAFTNYTQFYDDISNYDDKDYQTKITDFVDHPITRGVDQWYLKGGHINVTGSTAEVLATASETAYYQLDAAGDTWVNGTDINVMAIHENTANSGSVIFTYAYILREDYTLSYGKTNSYDGMKLINNIVTWVTDVSAPLFEYGVIPDDIHPPADITYEEGALGNIITWQPSDDNPATYAIYKDGTVVTGSSGAWDGMGLTITVDGLAIGTYNYTCVVTDTNDRTASDTVIVTVVEEAAESSEDGDSPGLTAPIVLLAMIPVAIVAIRRRRKG